jgi:hypothetical protein
MRSSRAPDVITAGAAMVVFAAQQVGPLETVASFGRFPFAALDREGIDQRYVAIDAVYPTGSMLNMAQSPACR